MSGFPYDPWKVREVRWDPARYAAHETLFALGNGTLGVRGHFEEGFSVDRPIGHRATYVNGFYETYPIRYPEGGFGYPLVGQTMVPVPDATGLRLLLDDEPVDLARGEVLAYERVLDLAAGTLTRIVHWRSPSRREIVYRFRRVVPFTRPGVLAIRLEVFALAGVRTLTIESTLSGEVRLPADEGDHRVGVNIEGPLFDRLAQTVNAPERNALERQALEANAPERLDDGGPPGGSGGGMAWRTRRSGLLIAAYVVHDRPVSEIDVRSDSPGGELVFRYAVHAGELDGTRAPGRGSGTADATQSEPLFALTKVAAYVSAAHGRPAHEQGGDRRAAPEGAALYGRTAHDWPAYGLNAARQICEEAARDGFARLVEEQAAYLQAFWRDADVIVDGDEAIQQAIRFSMFHLLQSTGQDGMTAIGAKGLTGPGYEGHYFWDMDIYILPFFLFTRPKIARALLLFRYRLLPAARSRAKELGYPGALYPWRTISGPECSTFFPAGTAQIHINADIVYALKQYVDVTGDREFLERYGLEMAAEIARFYVRRGTYSARHGGRFCYFTVTGPDEYTVLVDNNAYTNAMAAFAMAYAASELRDYAARDPAGHQALVERLEITAEEVQAWADAAQAIYIPEDAALGIVAQDDTFLNKPRLLLADIPPTSRPLLLHRHYLDIYRYQVAKQPDTLMWCFLDPDRFSREAVERMYDYYEPITTHDSSLSPPVFSVLAHRIGRFEDAYRYFRMTARMDLDDVNGNVKDGIHAASMGGSYLAVLYGFGGLIVSERGLRFAPRLPEAWRRLLYRIRYRGRLIEIDVRPEDVRLTLLEGEPLSVTVYEAPLEFVPGIPRTVEIPKIVHRRDRHDA